jgi:hypothetical protein
MVTIRSSLEVLNYRADIIFKNHIRPRTQRSYAKIVERYKEFCYFYKIQAFPASVRTIRLYMAFLAETCSGDTIANHISAIRTFCQTNSIPCGEIMDNYIISRSIKALKHLKPTLKKQAKRELTVEHLQAIFPKLDMSFYDHKVFWSMITLGFYGLFRLGELTKHTDTRRHLRYKHVKWHANGVIITLPASKTDQNYVGAEIFIKRTSDVTCPVAALRWMMQGNNNESNLLFYTSKGIATRSWFISHLNHMISKDAGLSGHSLRRGGASFAAAQGLTHEQIMRLGRWSSNSFRIYLRNHPQLDAIIRLNPTIVHNARFPLT